MARKGLSTRLAIRSSRTIESTPPLRAITSRLTSGASSLANTEGLNTAASGVLQLDFLGSVLLLEMLEQVVMGRDPPFITKDHITLGIIADKLPYILLNMTILSNLSLRTYLHQRQNRMHLSKAAEIKGEDQARLYLDSLGQLAKKI